MLLKIIYLALFLISPAALAQGSCSDIFAVKDTWLLFEGAVQSNPAFKSAVENLENRGITIEFTAAGKENLAFVVGRFKGDEPFSYDRIIINKSLFHSESVVPAIVEYITRIERIIQLEEQGARFSVGSLIITNADVTITQVKPSAWLTDPTLIWMSKYRGNEFVFQLLPSWWGKYAPEQWVNINGNQVSLKPEFLMNRQAWNSIPALFTTTAPPTSGNIH